MIFVDSNLDEMRCEKLLHWNVDLKCRSGFSTYDSRKVSDEEVCCKFKHAGRHSGEYLLTWVKVE